jgi:hypothetical protein
MDEYVIVVPGVLVDFERKVVNVESLTRCIIAVTPEQRKGAVLHLEYHPNGWEFKGTPLQCIINGTPVADISYATKSGESRIKTVNITSSLREGDNSLEVFYLVTNGIHESSRAVVKVFREGALEASRTYTTQDNLIFARREIITLAGG